MDFFWSFCNSTHILVGLCWATDLSKVTTLKESDYQKSDFIMASFLDKDMMLQMSHTPSETHPTLSVAAAIPSGGRLIMIWQQIHTYTHTYTHIYIHTYTYTHIHTHTYIHTYIHTYVVCTSGKQSFRMSFRMQWTTIDVILGREWSHTLDLTLSSSY